jgi:hypothetical protein
LFERFWLKLDRREIRKKINDEQEVRSMHNYGSKTAEIMQKVLYIIFNKFLWLMEVIGFYERSK